MESQPNDIIQFRVGSEDFIEHREEDLPRVYWWGITRGSMVYAACGHSSMDAYEAVADEIGISVDELLRIPTFAELYSDEVQSELTDTFGERKAVRLLAWSTVEWPEDMAYLTDAQREHGIKHGWLNPDGTPRDKL